MREQAIKRLAQDESSDALPFLLVRAVDWVAPVRVAAQLEICRRLQSRYAGPFVSCLSLLDRLCGSHRFAPELRDSIERFLREPQSARALQSGLQSNDYLLRRHSFALAVENPAFKVRDVIEAAASDADVLIRKWAFTFAQSEMLDAWPELRTRAARDPFSPIRRIAFDSLNAETAPPTDQLLAFLLDSSPAIRHSAQDRLPKLLNIPVDDYYRAAIDAGRGARTISALGLAEVGDATDAPMIAVLMHDSSAKTRAAAIRALRLLNIVDIDALIKAVNSDVPSVAREAVVSLLRGHLLSPDLIWKEALANRDPIVWRTALKSFSTAGKWIRLRVYLEAIATNDDSVSAFAIERVRIWLAQYNRSFTLPDTSESGRISSLLAGVRHKLPVEVGRELGFVIETVLKPAHNAWPSTTRSDVR